MKITSKWRIFRIIYSHATKEKRWLLILLDLPSIQARFHIFYVDLLVPVGIQTRFKTYANIEPVDYSIENILKLIKNMKLLHVLQLLKTKMAK